MGLLESLGRAVLNGMNAMVEHAPEMLERQQNKTNEAYRKAYEAEKAYNRNSSYENYENMERARARADEMNERTNHFRETLDDYYERRNGNR